METAVTVTHWNPLVPACTGSYLFILACTSLQESIAKFSGIMRAHYESIGSMKLPFLEYLPHGNWQMPPIRLFLGGGCLFSEDHCSSVMGKLSFLLSPHFYILK